MVIQYTADEKLKLTQPHAGFWGLGVPLNVKDSDLHV